MGYDGQYRSWALIYIICGMSLGAVMATAHSDVQYLSPSHVLYVGLVLSLVYGVIHKLWLVCTHPFNACPSVMRVLRQIHQAGMLTMFTALLLMYGTVFLDVQTEPLQATASIAALIVSMPLFYVARQASAASA